MIGKPSTAPHRAHGFREGKFEIISSTYFHLRRHSTMLRTAYGRLGEHVGSGNEPKREFAVH